VPNLIKCSPGFQAIKILGRAKAKDLFLNTGNSECGLPHKANIPLPIGFAAVSKSFLRSAKVVVYEKTPPGIFSVNQHCQRLTVQIHVIADGIPSPVRLTYKQP